MKVPWLVLLRRTLALWALTAGTLAAATVSLAPALRTMPIGQAAGPALYAMTALLVVAIALIACLTPALRVARVNPGSALRHQ